MDTGQHCWICSGTCLSLLKRGRTVSEGDSTAFCITDAHYGMTGTLYRCEACGFVFCPELGNVLPYYEALQDPGYEQTRETRSLQQRKLLGAIGRYQSSGRLLDIGAASGILVEEALQAGYRAEGIEPSAWLCEQAARRGLPVVHGCLPHPSIIGTYDVVMMVDVLEHVTDPLTLLAQALHHLAPDGILVIVTPDVASFAARLLGKRWWHYRLAHVGFFDRRTLQDALHRSGMTVLAWRRPTWFFPLNYLLVRLGKYLPFVGRLARWSWTGQVTVPVNLRDSLMVIARHAPSNDRPAVGSERPGLGQRHRVAIESSDRLV
jgi:SAM-dependent methyltransferase